MAAVLITAGATRNPVDAMRYLSAHASGRTGVGIAQQLAAEHRVRLLGSAEACLRGAELRTEEFTSTRDLQARMERWCRAHPHGIVVHSAAVGDYEAKVVPGKIPSGQPAITLTLTPTPKIVDQLRDWTPDLYLVSFKAADPSTSPDELEAIARAQLVRTRSDLVFANVLGSTAVDVLLVGPTGSTRFARREDGITALVHRIRDYARKNSRDSR